MHILYLAVTCFIYFYNITCPYVKRLFVPLEILHSIVLTRMFKDIHACVVVSIANINKLALKVEMTEKAFRYFLKIKYELIVVVDMYNHNPILAKTGK